MSSLKQTCTPYVPVEGDLILSRELFGSGAFKALVREAPKGTFTFVIPPYQQGVAYCAWQLVRAFGFSIRVLYNRYIK